MKEGWQTKTLGEVCDVMNGGTPKTGVPDYWGDEHRWITPAEMGKRSNPYVSDTERRITEAGLRNSSAQMLPPYSVILSSRAPIGHLVINTEPMATNQGCKGLVPKNSLLKHKFIYYYLTSIVELLNNLGTGATFKELSGGKLKEVAIPIPTLPEQKRIVAMLDEAFEGIATAKANAEKNLESARAVFENELDAIFTRKGEGWEDRRLGDIFEIGSSKRIYENEWTSTGIPFYGGREIVQLAKFGVAKSNSYISESKYEEYASKYDMPQSDDIVMTARGTIGVGYVVQEGDRFYYKDGNVISLRQKIPANPYFALYAFRSREAKEKISRLTGTTVVHLSIEKAKELKLYIPDFETQNHVTEKLDILKEETQRLESIYKRKLSELDALKKSLLHHVFTGHL